MSRVRLEGMPSKATGHTYDGCDDCRTGQRAYNAEWNRRYYQTVSLDSLPWQPGVTVHDQMQSEKNSGDVTPKNTVNIARSWPCTWADHGECQRADCACRCHGVDW